MCVCVCVCVCVHVCMCVEYNTTTFVLFRFKLLNNLISERYYKIIIYIISFTN